MKFPVIIAVRLGSTRLPGKCLLPFLDGSCMLDEIIKRVKSSNLVDEICIATTINAEDDILEDYAIRNDIKCFRGSEKNVADRIYQASKLLEAEYFFEVLGDNPLIDPSFFEVLYKAYNINNNLKYASFNTVEYNFNDKTVFPVGVRIQLVKTNEFIKILETNNDYFYEHATSFFYNKIDQKNYVLIENLKHNECEKINLAVNTIDDFYLVATVINESTNFRWENSVELYKLLK